ncbi:MAG: hypothetical protein IJB67_05230 [Firmicutes bacterium]|nr:hypothetical protein [Bacillota bacterium]
MPSNTFSTAEVIDITQYNNIENITSGVSSEPNYELIKQIVSVGQTHATKKYAYVKDIADYIEQWKKKLNAPNPLNVPNPIINLADNVYTQSKITVANNNEIDLEQWKKRELEFMKNVLPVSYVLWGGICLALALITTVMLAYAIYTGIFIIGPWLNCMLCVASWGMTITVLVAMQEWRSRSNDKEGKKRT